METIVPRFIADVHVGKLARILRMLGFDTLYCNAFSNEAMVRIAQEEQRVLLSRNANIDKKHAALHTFIILHDEPAIQLEQVLQHYQLLPHIQPFSRCMICNEMLAPVVKENIIKELPEKTAQYYHEFWQCTNCKRIYWKGPHYNRMMRLIQKITGNEVG